MSSQNISQTTVATVNSGLINPTVSEFFLTFNLLICAEIIGTLGIVGNIINIWNFTKQGLNDSVNITLTALAVSDIGALVTQKLFNILASPFWTKAELMFNPFAILAMFSFYPHGYFIRVSGFITSFAAIERCCCVILPLKVKSIFTKHVALVVNCAIFIVFLLHLFPQYYVIYIDWKFAPKFNRTILSLFYRSNAESVLKVSYFITDMFVPYVTFLMLILSTVIISVELKSKAQWRMSVSGQLTLSGKEKKVVIMLTTVSIIFIVCLVPQSALLTALGIVRELKVDGAYFDVAMLCYSVTFLMETINCTVNIIVYYHMSTKYRDNILKWVVCLRKTKH